MGPACQRQASPCQRQARPCQRQATSCQRQATPCPRQASSCPRQASPCQRRASSCQRQASPCQRQATPCRRQATPCPRQTSPCRRQAQCSRIEHQYWLATASGLKVNPPAPRRLASASHVVACRSSRRARAHRPPNGATPSTESVPAGRPGHGSPHQSGAWRHRSPKRFARN